MEFIDIFFTLSPGLYALPETFLFFDSLLIFVANFLYVSTIATVFISFLVHLFTLFPVNGIPLSEISAI